MGGGGAGPYAGGVIGQARRGGRVPAAGQRRASVLRASRRDAQKKTAHAAEQDREDVAAEREAWLEAQPHLDPPRLVFLDETGTSTTMARVYGRAPPGQTCRAPAPPRP